MGFPSNWAGDPCNRPLLRSILSAMSEESRNWKEIPMDWIEARWRWLIVAVVLLFAFNNLVGLVVGITGLIAFANRVAGRVLKARRVVQQVQQIVTNPDDRREGG